MKGIKQLQNGTDVRGVALDIVPDEKVTLTGEKVGRIAQAFTVWLAKQKKIHSKQLRISIGRDSRLSGPELLSKAAEGIITCGATAVDCGIASTPAMFMSTVMDGFNYDGAIMITASHLPPNRNGMKFFISSGGLEKTDILDILTIAECDDDLTETESGVVIKTDIIDAYSAGIVDVIREKVNGTNYKHPLAGFKIVVDAGNGAGGFFAKKVLEQLGADTTGSCFLEPDGEFPNHIPNPELKEAMDALRDAVLSNQADLGISFDTDVDRAAAVDAQGNEINRNRLIALMSAIVLEQHPNSWIVTDSITSTGLTNFITQLGGTHHRFKRGYKNVINESKRLNNEGNESWLAIETSGHGALKQNYFLDDGAYLIACILIKMAQLKQEGKELNDLISNLQEPYESEEFRFGIKTEDFATYGQKILADLNIYAKEQPHMTIEEPNYEGMKINFNQSNGDGWLLLRLSLHDPILPLNIESDSAGGVEMIAKQLYEFIKDYDLLNLSRLTSYIQ
jgi:phosphomannomutase